jgi:hypothetical protein
LSSEKWKSEEYRSNFEKMVEQVENLIDADYFTVPLIPYVGKDFDRTRFMVVGKATNGWGYGREGWGWGVFKDVQGMPDGYEHLLGLPEYFVDNKLISYYGGGRKASGYRSQFWDNLYLLCGYLYLNRSTLKFKREAEPAKKIFRSIAWSNVFKIGALKKREGESDPRRQGNPYRALIEAQSGFGLLKKEIDLIKPKTILFSTGIDYDRYLKEALPEVDFVDVGLDDIGLREVTGLGCLAFRTHHVQARTYATRRKGSDWDRLCRYIKARVGETG